VLSGQPFKPSNNSYDWLGPGIYFWEANPRRGLDYAKELKQRKRGPKIEDPAVVGAIIELHLCLDLTTLAGIEQVKIAHRELTRVFDAAGQRPPRNNPDGLRRNLDCAVIRYLHEIRQREGKPAIDTVKGIFMEGEPIYAGSGFHEKTHVQISVCNPDCIKGVFRVPASFLA
jgi:hypothetical protein